MWVICTVLPTTETPEMFEAVRISKATFHLLFLSPTKEGADVLSIGVKKEADVFVQHYEVQNIGLARLVARLLLQSTKIVAVTNRHILYGLRSKVRHGRM